MEDFTNNHKAEIGSEKSFAYTFGFIFLLVSSFYAYKNIYGWEIFFSLGTSLFFFLSGYCFPQIFKTPNLLWSRIGVAIGKIVSPFVLGMIYVTLIIPIGILLKILKPNYLGIKIEKSKKSYWIMREKGDLNSMRKQF